MKLRYALSLSVAAAMLAVALPATAQQFAKPEDAIKYRQSAFTVMATHFGRVGAMVNGKAPFDAKVAQDSMVIVEMMSKLPYAGFGPGTEGGKAKASIWTDNAKFTKAAENMQAEVAKLNVAAKTGSLDAIKTSFGATGASCKACHDDFRDK